MTHQPPRSNGPESANSELLGSGEIGVVLTEAYFAAVYHDERLVDVPILEISEDYPAIGYAIPKWSAQNRTGQHEVHLRLGAVDNVLDYIKTELAIRPEIVELISMMLGILPSKLTPQLFYVFTMLHEMGHASDFFDYENDPEKFKKEKTQAEMKLPLGRISTKTALDPTSDVFKKLESSVPTFKKYGVCDVADLVAMNNRAYRKMPHERRADNFAVEVLERTPLLTAKLKRESIEPYRNFLGFGSAAT